jgi:Domain of unknown function (DUF222)
MSPIRVDASCAALEIGVFRYFEHMSESVLSLVEEVKSPVDVPIESMTDVQILDALVDMDKIHASNDARTARLLARFAELRPPAREGIAVADGAAEEVAAERGMNTTTAAIQMSLAHNMVSRLPATMAALEAGEIDYVRAKAMTELTAVLTGEQARLVEQKVLAQGSRANPGRFRASVRYQVIAADPAAAEKRRQAVRATRNVVERDLPEGMSQLAITLEPHEAQLAYDQINTLAVKAKTPGRSLGQCRADAFLDLVLGKDVRRASVNMNVVVPMTTLMGLNQHPGEISGFGPITAEYARELAQNATWRRMITDPAGQVLEVSRRRFASPALARHVRLRDRVCRQPGCARKADSCDIDHTIRHRHGGPTSLGNTSALCRQHNLVKERSTWVTTQPSPGTLVFQTPAKRTHVTTPEPYEVPPY